jgi:predicted lipoprotein
VQNVLRFSLAFGLLASVVTLDACRGGSGITGAAGSAPTGTAGTGAAGTSGEAGTGAAGASGDVDASVTDGAAGTGAAAFTKQALLEAFGSCAASHARTFRERAVALSSAVAALATAPDAAKETAAREAFGQAMEEWQTLELLQYGPAASSLVVGGRDLRDHIYGWPLFGRCAVEEGVTTKTYETPAFPNTLINRRGLAALDYLLFHAGTDSACAPGTPSEAAWNALTVEQRTAGKRAYAAAAAADIQRRAIALDEAWDPAKEDFLATMRTAGPGNAVYATQQAAIQTVGIALFYLDSTVKDLKLGEPLNNACASPACLETPYSARAKANLRGNLAAARLLLEGCEAGHAGLAFDDLLTSVGAPQVAASLHAQLAAAQAALDAIEEAELSEAFVKDAPSVRALRDAVAALTTTLKTTFVTVLGFELASVPTDNDT